MHTQAHVYTVLLIHLYTITPSFILLGEGRGGGVQQFWDGIEWEHVIVFLCVEWSITCHNYSNIFSVLVARFSDA